MKTKFALFALAVIFAFSAKAQELEDTTLGRMKLNFVVPDMPAFKLLGTDPTNLLKPSTPKALALSMSSFTDNGKFIIPKAFALEISPALLLNSRKGPSELAQYAKNAVLNSFRISIGTSNDSSLSISGRNLAIGLRISLINEGDFGMDATAHQAIAKELRKFRKQVDSREKQEKFAISIDSLDAFNADTDAFIERRIKDYNKYLSQLDEPSQKEFQTAVKKLKEEYKKKHWNDEKLDLAIAVLTSSPDSILRNLRFNQAQLWLTWAHKVGRSNKSQFMAGINAQIAKDLKDTVKSNMKNSYFNLCVPARFIIGTNRIKGFAEGQYKYDGRLKESNIVLCLGSEINLIDGVWLNMYGGFNYSSKSSSTKPVFDFNFKLTMPENFKFF